MNPFSAPNMAAEQLEPAAFEALARARLLPSSPLLNEPQSPGDDDLNPGLEKFPSGLRHAAVLVPVIARSPLTVLLTARTDHLPSHAGQIAFPGGKVETFDVGPFAAAVREAREEIALDEAFISRIGYLSPYRTGTGYIITPCVALVRPGFTLTINPEEVADVFEVPFAFLMNEANHEIHTRSWGGAERRFYAMPYEERYIWGATAGIIRMLYRRLFIT